MRRAAENRYDLGFSELVGQLADAGYLALSMNVAINYSFEDGEPAGNSRTLQVVEQQTVLLRRAVAGEQGLFPCDLTGKGDLDNVILIGHSRAGYDVFDVARTTQTMTVRGIIAAAPAVIYAEGEPLPDIPAGIIISQYGGTELLRYSTFTPLGTLRLDLRAFAGVDLSALQEITLTFDQPAGSIMLREIEAV